MFRAFRSDASLADGLTAAAAAFCARTLIFARPLLPEPSKQLMLCVQNSHVTIYVSQNISCSTVLAELLRLNLSAAPLRMLPLE